MKYIDKFLKKFKQFFTFKKSNNKEAFKSIYYGEFTQFRDKCIK